MRKPGRSVEAETCAPKAGCAKFAIYDKIVAVYDKKMLWRANLYIDKKEESLGGVDRNDAHPWNAPLSVGESSGTWGDSADNSQTRLASWNANDWGYNDWNDMTATIKGGQISINPWTRWNDDATVYNSVAYGWGGMDSVSEFNSSLESLSSKINDMRQDTESFPDYANLNWISPQTEAPNNKWMNYPMPNEYCGYNNVEVKVKKQNGDVNEYYSKALDVSFKIPKSDNIKIPGFSTYWSEQYETVSEWNVENSIYENKKKYIYDFYWNHNNNSSGLDCSGFATIAMGYKLNGQYIYVAAKDTNGNLTKLSTTEFVKDNNSIMLRNGDWMLESDDEENNAQKIEDQKLLSHAVPGDVFVKSEDHIVIIQNLNYNEGKTVITNFKDVDVIHSTKGITDEGLSNEWKVMKSTLHNVSNDIKKYELRRLMI